MEKKGLLFVLPALIGTFLFIIIPIFCSFGLSFSEWDLLNEIHYVGFSNYKSVFTEPEFLQILINTIVYAVLTTIFAVIIRLLISSIIRFEPDDSTCFLPVLANNGFLPSFFTGNTFSFLPFSLLPSFYR